MLRDRFVRENVIEWTPPSGRPTGCLIDAAIQREIDEGVPPHRRTKAWYISCPCAKCNPYFL